MKNYVVWTNCRITADDGRQLGMEPPNAEHYTEMFEISRASARQYLGGTWTDIVFTDPAPTRVEMFQANWQRIWDLWHQEPCNILYLDSDTVFQRATDIFGRFDQFRLFNWTTPNRKGEFHNYFNAGVRYYPATMSRTVWQLGADSAADWNLDIWDQEQIIFNKMFWSQNLDWSDAHRPELNWQLPANSTGLTMTKHNGCDQCTAHIIHYHGTRSSARAVKLAQDLARRAGIKYEIN